MPPDIDEETLRALCNIQYGVCDVDIERILACRHFADFFGWNDAVASIDYTLEAYLDKRGDVDADSALAIFAFCAESSSAASLPSSLRSRSYAAALRWFMSASDEAQAQLSAETRSRLRMLSKIRNRFGHI